MAFGHGPHRCLGAQPARMEPQVALGALLQRLPGLRVAGTEQDIAWKTGTVTRGLRPVVDHLGQAVGRHRPNGGGSVVPTGLR
ncbi:cytochrome P450 [Actinomadura physcomitrii]|uniref:cytochrome P450 n=1 Tax=Actinomadura physcomitrii TaxID=2650748 RepID=UPI002E25CA12